MGASLGASRAFFPLVENFIFKGSILGIILGDLFSFLCQSIDWFKGLVSERGIMSEVRSSELEIGLSSSDDPMEMGDDTAISIPREVRAFSALKEECGLDAKILSRFSQRFQFSDRVRVRLPRPEERACHFSPGEVCFYEAASLSGLRFPVHPFIMELLNHFRITPRQLIPNSLRIVVSYMEIWLAATDRDMIKVDELVYLYCLKESKEYGYYELVPWVREARIVRDLPSSFRYWKSRLFFVFGDEFKNLSSEVWGDVPKLLRRWGTPSLGASSFH